VGQVTHKRGGGSGREANLSPKQLKKKKYR